jgi:hypothetical protein
MENTRDAVSGQASQKVRSQESGVAGVQNADTLAGTDTGVTSTANLVEIFVARSRLVTVHKSKSRRSHSATPELLTPGF